MLGLRLRCTRPVQAGGTRRWLAVAAKAKTVSRVRGTRDLLAEDSQQHREVLDVLQRTVERYGFRSIQTPLLEYTDLFSRSLGDGSDIVMKEMYTFQDNSGKSVTLRPEGTAGIMRALVSNNLLFSLPQKLSYSGSMFRYERPQRGRYREFQQFGVEFVGSSGPSVDAEVIAMAADALDSLGIKDKVVLELNSLGDNESRTRYRAALEAFFSKLKNDLSSDSINRLERGSVLRILDSKSEVDQKIIVGAPQLGEFLSDEAKTRFDDVLSGLDALGIAFRQNSRLVRGLDYYSNTVFEFVEKPAPAASSSEEATAGGIAVLAGGCYDGLAESLGGPATACVGWAAGVDRLNLLREMPTETAFSIAVVPVLAGDNSIRVLHEAMRVAQILRQRGLTVHFCHGRGNMKKQMKAAERYGSTHAVILGGTEIEQQCVKVKNLEKREEAEVLMAELGIFDFEVTVEEPPAEELRQEEQEQLENLGLQHSEPQDMEIWCLIVGMIGTAFPVIVKGTDRVWELQKTIKNEAVEIFRDFNAAQLRLYLAKKDNGQWLSAAEVTGIENGNAEPARPLLARGHLASMSQLAGILKDRDANAVHILVPAPSRTSEIEVEPDTAGKR
ncbi:Histidine--tRNA ligase [Phytophthora fragariae]|nr:Histidine--tRNA ligase [Phytophthora fragariae]KAE9247571.1 Histidine--tRNA ligase [Phytophthora fragariae]